MDREDRRDVLEQERADTSGAEHIHPKHENDSHVSYDSGSVQCYQSNTAATWEFQNERHGYH